MIVSFIRTIILYIAVIVALRVMGKRQIGEMQPSEFVIAIMLGDLASVPMQEPGMPLINGLIPIFTLVLIELTFSFMSLKSKKARRILAGRPSIVIKNGKINRNEMRKLRFNLDDLLEELYIKGIMNVSDVEMAVIDTNGVLSVLQKSNKRPVTPEDLNLNPPQEKWPFVFISDGRLISENLKKSGVSEKELKKMLHQQNINDYKEVFLATYTENDGLFVQTMKEGNEQ